MLTELRVRDLGVIEDLSLTFGAGMTVLTGETGAGKTLVVEALQLVLGGRANPAIVRAGATEALVEARFVVGAAEGEREVIIARAVPADGRSRAWVDGRMSSVSAKLSLFPEKSRLLFPEIASESHLRNWTWPMWSWRQRRRQASRRSDCVFCRFRHWMSRRTNSSRSVTAA